MNDQDKIYTIVTALGSSKLAYALATGQSLDITEMAIGDGNGAVVNPGALQTDLVREVYRAPLNSLEPHSVNPNWLVAELIIPPEVGGFTVRELALYDDAGAAIFLGNHPEQYKPIQAQGSEETKVIRMIVVVSSVAAVSLKTDPSTVLLTREYYEAQEKKARDDLANQVDPAKGASLVGYKDRTVHARLASDPMPKDFGAVGDGVVNDTAAFTALEAAARGRLINLGGLKYLVDDVPLKNSYYNGEWVLDGVTLPAVLGGSMAAPGPRFKSYGGQLEALKDSLCDPLEQFTGIVFIGDSITWGATLPENLSPGSDLTTLATRRDLFRSPSFVNQFKRYIGKEYFDNAQVVVSNWPASSAGEAIAEYTKTVPLYPLRAPFSNSVIGTASVTETSGVPSSLTGYQAVLNASAGENSASFSFNFTGEKFSLVFSAVAADAGQYEVIVDGLSLGLFDTQPNGSTISNMSFGNRIDHSFGFVKNKTVVIKLSGSGYQSIRRLRIEAIEIPKTVRITNQGISGSNSTRYKTRALTTAHLPDIAVTPKDSYVFVMLGTNDRGPDRTWPNGINSFKLQMEELLDIVDPLSKVILMSSSAVADSNQAGKTLTMQQIRGALNQIARARNYDFIDGYAVFINCHPDVVLADGLHPNRLGHDLLFKNIVDALESS